MQNLSFKNLFRNHACRRLIKIRPSSVVVVGLFIALVAGGCGKGQLLAPRGSGTIKIVSEPQGAVIVFDGSPKGWTYEKKPVEIKGVRHGWHTIRATLPGRVPRVEEVELNGSELEVRIPLGTDSFGRVTIYSDPPGGEVFIGSRFFGAANPKLEINSLPYGEHTLWVRLKGYQEKRRNVIVERQADRAYRVRLQKE